MIPIRVPPGQAGSYKRPRSLLPREIQGFRSTERNPVRIVAGLENWKSGVPASAMETTDYPETHEEGVFGQKNTKSEGRRPSLFVIFRANKQIPPKEFPNSPCRVLAPNYRAAASHHQRPDWPTGLDSMAFLTTSAETSKLSGFLTTLRRSARTPPAT